MTGQDGAGEDSGAVGDGEIRSTGDEVDDGSTTDADRSGVDGAGSTVSVYRWTCPICDESRTGIASGTENPLAKAAFSLRQHVRTSVDGDHGPANAFPPEFDPDAAGRAVSVD